ncbi:MAG TPA: hypothetical protein VFG43_02235 [Geminicoccaceae bacterium]|nr:hypothetical protein [Geminicoccaceae bacterium]
MARARGGSASAGGAGRRLALLTLAFLPLACARSVIVDRPEPGAGYANPLTIDLALHDRAVQQTFRAELDGQDITGQFAFAGTPRRASAQMPPLQRSPHILRVEAEMSPRRPFDSTGRNIDFRITSVPPPPPGGGGGGFPAIDLRLVPGTLELAWGTGATVTATVEGRNGFGGTVDLALFNPPVGVAAPPAALNVPLNGTASAPLVLATVAAGTALQPGPVQVRASPQTGAPAQTRSIALRVDRTPGSFANPVTLTTGSGSCGPINAAVTGTSVNITGPFGNTNPQSLAFSQGYALSPNCRAAVVVTPVGAGGEPNVDLLNLAFPATIGADPPGRIVANPAGFFVEGRFSPDDSLFVLVTPGTGTGQAASAGLYDVPTGAQIGAPKHFTATVDGVTLAGRTVTLATTPPLARGQDEWTLP